MYKYLKLFNLKGLKECSLPELGQINIICGKNNSGKSTLLEAILTNENKTLGKLFSKTEIDHFYNDSYAKQGWDQTNKKMNNAFKEAINAVVNSQPIWYFDQIEEFRKKLIKEIRRNELIAGHGLDETALKNAFIRTIVAGAQQVILIPPKRQMEIEKNILGLSDPITPLGGGILNHLFHARNQPDESEEKKIFNKIQEGFLEISGGYIFDVFMRRENIANLNFSYRNQSWISADACGLGLQDLLILLWFSVEPSFNTLLIEEPESHLHPDMQRRLLSFFREQKDKQYFITTHSNIFVNNAYVDKVFFTQFKDSISVDDATSRASILNDIGYDVTDNLISDLVILVEGPKDVPFVEEFLIKYNLYSKSNIKIWPLGGDIMAQLDLSVFTQSYKLIALVDKDPSSNQIRRKFIENCVALNVPVHQTERYAIENYFPLSILQEVFVNQIDENINSLDPNVKLEEQIKINVKNNNRKIAQKMNIENIQGTDLEVFFNKVVELVS